MHFLIIYIYTFLKLCCFGWVAVPQHPSHLLIYLYLHPTGDTSRAGPGAAPELTYTENEHKTKRIIAMDGVAWRLSTGGNI